MGEATTIEWVGTPTSDGLVLPGFTFNAWEGCYKISPACAHCYAAARDARWHAGEHWGKDAPRYLHTASYWRKPHRWNREAERMGIRRKVFCSSLADVFEDRRDLDEHRLRLWQIIEATPWLDWLLLTKRPENMRRMLPAAWLDKPRLNVWAGTTVETQPYTWRIDELLAVPAVVHFLSCEPLLGALDVTPWLPEVGRAVRRSTVAWVLIGSESGPGARPMKIEWARSLVEQCKAAGVACFTKQIANASDRKGGDPRFWPPGDWPREFPEVRS